MNTNMLRFIKAAVVSAIVGLAGCGGGGGGGGPSGPVQSTLSFRVQSGMNSAVASGRTVTLTAKGTAATEATDGLCSGTYKNTDGAPTGGATFEGTPALSVVTVTTLSFTNCTPASSSITGTSYYSSNYDPLGFDIQGGEYGVYQAPPSIPGSVKVGDAGILGTITLYSDNTKATVSGREDLSFVIEPETADTALVNLITKDYDTGNALLSTEQDRYRITSTGAVTLVSMDLQVVGGPHLVFRE